MQLNDRIYFIFEVKIFLLDFYCTWWNACVCVCAKTIEIYLCHTLHSVPYFDPYLMTWINKIICTRAYARSDNVFDCAWSILKSSSGFTLQHFHVQSIFSDQFEFISFFFFSISIAIACCLTNALIYIQ